MSKRAVLTGMMLVLVGAVAPAYAQEAAPVVSGGMSWQVASILAGGFALAIAAGLGALGQGKAIASATEAIARNPSAAGEIRGALILGLVLIESLSIYVLLISLILFFLQPFAPKP